MKIKEEELEKIIKQQTDLNNLTYEIGSIEIQKHVTLHKLSMLNKNIEDYKSVLENLYGHININLEDGTYTKIEQDVEGDKKD
tara:strand:- start:415 stop:663 length:249 start_codon:yes stop_codon:yes gene_type:complete